MDLFGKRWTSLLDALNHSNETFVKQKPISENEDHAERWRYMELWNMPVSFLKLFFLKWNGEPDD